MAWNLFNKRSQIKIVIKADTRKNYLVQRHDRGGHHIIRSNKTMAKEENEGAAWNMCNKRLQKNIMIKADARKYCLP